MKNGLSIVHKTTPTRSKNKHSWKKEFVCMMGLSPRVVEVKCNDYYGFLVKEKLHESVMHLSVAKMLFFYMTMHDHIQRE